MDVTTCTEQEFLAGKHLPPGETVLHTLILKQAKVRTGFFKSRRIDGHVLILTDHHIVDAEWDSSLNGYYGVTRWTYPEVTSMTLFTAKKTLVLFFNQRDNRVYDIGPAAQQVHDAILARGGQAKAASGS